MYALQIQTFEKNLRWIKDETSKPCHFFQHQLLYYEDQYSELVSMTNEVELMLGASFCHLLVPPSVPSSQDKTASLGAHA